MLRIDRTAQFLSDSLMLHINEDARFHQEPLVILHIDPDAQYLEDHLVLHIDRTAQFRRERVGGFFSKKIHRFYFKVGTRKFKYEGPWTREEFRSLEGQQKEVPVPLTTENGSGKTWWIFQDAIYWEDYSAREVQDKRRSRLEVMSEVKAIFSEGSRSNNGISKQVYRFNCGLDRQKIQQKEFLTEKQYDSLLNKSKEDPVPLFSDSGKTWWMFQSKFYWAESGLKEKEVIALFLEGTRTPFGISKEPIYRFSGRPGREEKECWTEEQYQDLLAKQKEVPVQVLRNRESGETWWKFQGKFYWAEGGLREEEVIALFLEGIRTPFGISKKPTYRFSSQLSKTGREDWTAEQHHDLLAEQKEVPIQVLKHRESGKTWWMFHDKFYWAENDLNENEIEVILVEQPQKRKSELRLEQNEVKETLKNLRDWENPRDPDVAIQIRVQESRQTKTEHALHIIEMGQYGFCEHCEERIPPERLEALPHATQCTNCQRNGRRA